jgi:uncharacterized protein YukE
MLATWQAHMAERLKKTFRGKSASDVQKNFNDWYQQMAGKIHDLKQQEQAPSVEIWRASTLTK